MQNLKNMTIAIAVLSLLLLTVVLSTPVQQVEAQNIQTGDSGPLPVGITPDNNIETKAFLSLRPNPVGINQAILINMWINPSTTSGRRLMDFSVTMTKPDGTKETKTLDSYYADSTAWFEYTPDQVGTWKLKFDFAGGYFAAGPVWDFRSGGYLNYTESIYYQPASTAEQTLTVQQEQVMSWPPSPLPTDYWTRPVQPEHREWWPILGNYQWRGPGGGPTWDALYPNTNPYWSAQQAFTPWVQGPNSGHVAWKQLGADAGIIGGQEGFSSWPFNFNGAYYNPPSIVFQGRIYQTVSKPGTSGPSAQNYWQCIDLRTGALIWERALFAGETEPNIVAYESTAGNVPGAQEKAAGPQLLSIGNGYLRKYNPFNGAMTLNVSIAPLTGTGGTYYMDSYVLTIRDLGSSAGAQRYRLTNWTTAGTSSKFTDRIISNTTYVRSSLPSYIDWNVGAGANVGNVDVEGAYVGIQIQGFDLITGASLWNVTVDEPTFSSSASIADHGKIAILSAYGYYLAYDLRTGKLAWKSEQFEEPWGTFAGYNVQSAYGLLYRGTYAAFYAIDWNTGKIVWKYTSPSVFPYDSEVTGENDITVNPFRCAAVVADGKVFVNNQRQGGQNPMPRGWSTYALNATTGEVIWEMMIGGSVYNQPLNQIVVSDGYMILNGLDGYNYAFGKGKTITTITAPDVAVPKGTNILIRGTVLDQSQAQPNTPCVSKNSMSTQMEYLHKQMPIDGIYHNESITGVPLTLTAIAADGSVIDIGTVTTNGYYGTFNKDWTPSNEGTYEIIASFLGDDSYASSAASIAIKVGPAPASSDNQQEITIPDYTVTILGVGVAVIIAVVISVAIAIVVLRKR